LKEDLQILETIDNYLNDRMSQEERIAFEQKMASDSALAQKVEGEREINEAIHFANLAELREGIGKEIKNIKYTSENSFNKYLISGLIILGTGVATYLIVDQKESDAVSTKTENTIPQKKITPETSKQKPLTEVFIQNKSAAKKTSAQKEDSEILKTNKQTETPETEDSSNHILLDNTSQEINTVSKPITDTENTKSDIPIYTETKEPIDQPRLNSAKLARCNQTFTFVTKPSCQGKSTGTRSIRENLNHTYIYELDKVLTFPTNGVFSNVSAGKHEISIKYLDSCEYIETLTIGEEWCSLNHSFSFNPEYGEKWELLYANGDRGHFIILNNVGKELYRGDFGIGKCFWNGSDTYGSLLPTGTYLAIINHSDGRKEKVELTIVR
jgi:hypothetical protein